MGENGKGDTFYVDFERIRKHGGYVYFWYLWDLLKPTNRGILSDKTYLSLENSMTPQKESDTFSKSTQRTKKYVLSYVLRTKNFETQHTAY